MKKKKLQELAKKVQLEVKEEELSIYLKTFNQLEKLLVNWKKVKISKSTKLRPRIDTGSLTISDLEKIQKKLSYHRVNKKTQQNNAKTTDAGFILFSEK